ncbi:L-threonylcarbamoyladenylate synthase [Actinacidiphila oryziradicis]
MVAGSIPGSPRRTATAASRSPVAQPSPQDCDAAQGMLGDSVAVYLDGGPTEAAVASSIVDLTGPVPILKRAGAISAERLRKVATDLQEP